MPNVASEPGCRLFASGRAETPSFFLALDVSMRMAREVMRCGHVGYRAVGWLRIVLSLTG